MAHSPITKAPRIMLRNAQLKWFFVLATVWLSIASARADGEIEFRTANIFSEGTRIQADIYHAKSLAGKILPTIIMAHGWGGTAALLRTQATDFANAGYFVIAFDYRGWGNSDSRVMLTQPAPESKSGQPFSTEVKEIREVVDPVDQLQDYLNVIHWAMGEAMVDKNRIGLWGTSFSGGLVVAAAARDSRIKALVSQVGFFGTAVTKLPAEQLARARDDGTKRAHGELPYPPPRAREVGSLSGGPIREKFLLYDAVDDAAKVKNCAMLFIAAEKEELFDNKDHPEAAFKRAAEPKKYSVIPGIAHYGIYSQARQEASDLALDWFNQHLK
jgi:uncharacterized protein